MAEPQGRLFDFVADRPYAWDVIWMLMWINLTWALVNLLPVFPLDGGRICHALPGPRRERAALWISLVAAGATAAYCFSPEMLFGGLLFAMLAWNNWRRLHNEPEAPWMGGG